MENTSFASPAVGISSPTQTQRPRESSRLEQHADHLSQIVGTVGTLRDRLQRTLSRVNGTPIGDDIGAEAKAPGSMGEAEQCAQDLSHMLGNCLELMEQLERVV